MRPTREGAVEQEHGGADNWAVTKEQKLSYLFYDMTYMSDIIKINCMLNDNIVFKFI